MPFLNSAPTRFVWGPTCLRRRRPPARPRPGVTADVTVIDVQEGNFELIDQQNNKRMAKRKIVPVATVHGGTLMKIDSKVHEAVPHAGLKM